MTVTDDDIKAKRVELQTNKVAKITIINTNKTELNTLTASSQASLATANAAVDKSQGDLDVLLAQQALEALQTP